MLRRVNAALYEEDAGVGVEFAVMALNNNGIESARFDYDATVLPTATVQGHPGCRFDVQSGIRQLSVLVVFHPGAPATARYELLQVNAAGGLTPVGKSVTKGAGTPLIGFGIDGVMVMAPLGRGVKAAKKAKARKTAKRKTAKRKTAKRKTTKTRKTASKTRASAKRGRSASARKR